MSKDRFVGSWQVLERLYHPDGRDLGLVRQQRSLIEDEQGLVVDQICSPKLIMPSHPMADFAGKYTFRIQVDQQLRRYLGPDVVGCGIKIGSDVLIGRGILPRFGHQFDSWSINLSESLQLTGGVFYRLHQPTCVIVGGGAERNSGLQPQSVLDECWQGTNAEGELVEVDSQGYPRGAGTKVSRTMQNFGWSIQGEDQSWQFMMGKSEGESILTINDRFTGFAKAYGPLLHWECCDHHGVLIRGLEISAQSLGKSYSLQKIDDPKLGTYYRVISYR